jgi:enoyl-CoA hydratase/carnithine racemase
MNKTASPVVINEKRGQVQWITINRPDQGNAVNTEVIEGIKAGLHSAQTDTSIRAIVLTGAGEKIFCAGGDLKAGDEGTSLVMDETPLTNPFIDLFKEMETITLPTIARVNGHAMGGGLGLVCACDMAIASQSAKLGTPETAVGMFPMMILTYMLRILPRRKLMEICITGGRWSAQEALDADLINYAVAPEQLDEKLDWLLSRTVDKSPTAIRVGKTAFHAMQDMNIREAFEYAQTMLPLMTQTQDAKEGVAAYREKRAPVWTGN